MVITLGTEDASVLHESANCACVRLESLTYILGPLWKAFN